MTPDRILSLSDYHRLPQAEQPADFYKRLLEVVCNNATVALFIMDEHQQCVYMNPAAEALTGYNLAETRGRALHDVIHHTRPDGRPYPLCECPIDQAFPTNNQEQGEEVFVHKDGHFYPVAYTASPIREGDRVTGTIIEVRDITAEKEAAAAQAAARQREQALQAEKEAAQRQITQILESMSDAFVALDRDWNITYMNAEAERLSQQSQEQALGRSHWEVWQESIGTQLEVEYRRAVAEQIPVHFEYQYFSGAEERWVEVDVYPSAAGLGIFYRDITDRKQAEVTLKTSERRFRRLVESNLFGVAFGDFTANIFEANDYFLNMVGYSRAELEAGRVKWAEMTPPEYLALDLQAGEELRQHGVATPFEKEYIRQDGSRVPILIGGALLDEPYEQQETIVCFYLDLTQLKQAEQRLQLYADIVRNTQVGIVVWQLENPDDPGSLRLVAANPAAREATGMDFEQDMGCTMAERFPGVLRSPIIDQYLQVIRSGQAQDLQDVSYTEDGFNGIFAVKAFPLPNQSLGLAFENVTQQRRTEAALQENVERLQLALTAAQMGDWHWEATTDLVTLSERARVIFGVDPAVQVTWVVLQETVLLPADRDRARTAVEQAIRDHTSYNIEYRVLQSGGEQRWVSALGQAYYRADGTVVGMRGVLQDITERKQAEEALREANIQLESALMAGAIYTWRWNILDNRLTGNAGFAHLFGTNPEQTALGLPLETFVQSIHAEDRERVSGLIQRAIATGEPYAAEYRVYTTTGEVRWVMSRGAVEYDVAGNPVAFPGALADITERKQAEAERDQLLLQEQAAREAAESANRVKDEFLAVLSHELRSPLNPILGWARLLQTRQLDPTKTKQALETIERNARLQAELIEDLLDVSRILRGKLSLHVDAVNLTTIIQAAIETVRLAAEAKSIQIHTDLNTEVGLVVGDASRLQQVIWNLLSNAIKFTPSGGTVTVQLTHEPAEQANGYARITVSDTGKGIAPDFLPYVFEYFRQENSTTTRKYGGLGLGLAIVQHLVELHGGTVQAESPGENQGATFTVRLPLALHATAPDASQPPTLLCDLTGLRVLIVDDDPDTREFLAFLLQEAGATVQTAASALLALHLLTQYCPDILLSDIGMPEMDGYQLIRQIRTLSFGANLPAIALTAYAGEIDYQQAIAAGFQQHIPKPVDPERLMGAIATLTGLASNL